MTQTQENNYQDFLSISKTIHNPIVKKCPICKEEKQARLDVFSINRNGQCVGCERKN